MPNRLADASSPYLLQHKDNPVDWYPWGDEALARARELDRPIFLSIGYSACHWCHVMEHESFENEAIAAQLNESFVCIKVDREERPDLDQIYMNAVQLLTGRGGWPMSVFLAPDLRPFYGGTYWPPQRKMGMPGFADVLRAVDDAWQNRREQALEQAGELTRRIDEVSSQFQATGVKLDHELLRQAVARLERSFDQQHGGFGDAPKFPHTMDLQVLLRYWSRDPRDGVLQMVCQTLDKMYQGGLYDHLGGGFARYSVDARWLVPHFEKMLYDNSLLTVTYLEAYQATGHARYQMVVRETLDYILTQMTDERGGFYSTEDADSEGEEGKFYVWRPAEIIEVLGPERGERFCAVFDVSEQGNFEANNILNLPKTIEQCAALMQVEVEQLTAELAESRAALLHVRNQRIRPGLDDKILVSWNALMIDAMARAGAVLEEPRYLNAARRAAHFLLTDLRHDDGRLRHSWRRGTAYLDGYLDDHSYLLGALVSLYEADFDPSWIEQAVALAEQMIARFADQERGGFFFTADDHEQLITRNKDIYDGSVPSGNSMAATSLLRLAALTGRDDFRDQALRTIDMAHELMQRSGGAGQMLIAADLALGPLHEIVVVGDADSEHTRLLLRELRRPLAPRRLLASHPASSIDSASPLAPLLEGKLQPPQTPAVYICEGSSCGEPAYGLEACQAALRPED